MPTLRNEKCQEVALVIVVPIGIAIAFASRVSGIGTFLTSAQHLRGWEERRQAIAQAAEKAGRTRDLLARNGIDCRPSPGAGTGTFEFESESGASSVRTPARHVSGELTSFPRPRDSQANNRWLVSADRPKAGDDN